MIRRILLSFFFLIFVFFASYIIVYPQEVKIEAKKIEYDLPHPGILPDHPLYVIKAIRDKALIFFTRDSLKKAQIYLLFSDKRTNMAIELVKKGKWGLALTTFSKGEKYFFEIPAIIVESKKQGVSASNDLVLKVKLSHEKHMEIVEDFLKNAPSGQRKQLEQLLELEHQIDQKLSLL